ncbi:peptide chain release factor N(5)-glutamine methyltransferase [Litorihabitans aurantiacus]|uniref:Release factor glutamine methyltransferase n=1 Tax=Litorihabitans aurantiacus TaxID=1930061 RepID=A0AA37UUC7_9MICO|nr:peptide chain release factor N(5)-glutamine methyltransferase [Litorihabitans aurantiacus]GMA30687.1 protein-(glutamine-N5) methyltransferase, release factor-specific [Litorihabitans aurantiacus]
MTQPDLRSMVRGAAGILAEAGVPSPEHDARALATHLLDVPHLAYAPAELPDDFRADFAALVDRRRRREPLQHIVGHAAFRHVTLAAEPGVFVPRPETEVVAQHGVDAALAVAAAGREPLLVDLCCGAGGIAVSLAVEVPGARVIAVDASPEAVALTRRNHAANAPEDGAGVRVEQGDVRDPALLADLDGTVDVLVSNPPYIPPDAVPNEPEVREHDPDLALYGGGADGLEVPRAVVLTARRLLRGGGVFVMEHAEVQAAAVRAITSAAGFVDVTSFTDLTGRDRGVRAVAP